MSRHNPKYNQSDSSFGARARRQQEIRAAKDAQWNQQMEEAGKMAVFMALQEEAKKKEPQRYQPPASQGTSGSIFPVIVVILVLAALLGSCF